MHMHSPLQTPYLSLQLLHPGLGSLEGVSVGDIVDHDGGLGAAVVHRGEAVVALLARRVPDLELQTYIGCDCVLSVNQQSMKPTLTVVSSKHTV